MLELSNFVYKENSKDLDLAHSTLGILCIPMTKMWLLIMAWVYRFESLPRSQTMRLSKIYSEESNYNDRDVQGTCGTLQYEKTEIQKTLILCQMSLRSHRRMQFHSWANALGHPHHLDNDQ